MVLFWEVSCNYLYVKKKLFAQHVALWFHMLSILQVPHMTPRGKQRAPLYFASMLGNVRVVRLLAEFVLGLMNMMTTLW